MTPWLALLSAFLIALLSVPGLVRLAARFGLIDVPTARSTHRGPVPRVGGIAVLLGLLGGVLGLRWGTFRGFDDAAGGMAYLLPALCFFAIGLADDRWRLRPGPKFLLQALAALLAVQLGLRWGGEALGPFGALEFGVATPALTWLWLVAVGILVNFLDGLDLITSTTAIVLLGAAAGAGAGPGEGLLYALAACALLGFVLWNASPAMAFLGDAGTHLLGFLMGTAACAVPGSNGDASLSAALPWVAASAPLLPAVIDVGLGLWAKGRRGIPLSAPHNQHLHQRLARTGRGHVRVALRYGLLSLLGLAMVDWVASTCGLLACLLLSSCILLGHLLGALRATRGMPYRFETEP